MADAKLTAEDIALLSKAVLAHVATTMADGGPQVTPVWIETDGEAVLFNTAKGRVKHRNLVRDPRVAISVDDPQLDFRACFVRGRAELIDEGAEAQVDRLAKKYLGLDVFPHRRPGEERVIVRVVPESIVRVG